MENVVVATVNIGARLRKQMGTLYKINKPLSIKIFFQAFSSLLLAGAWPSIIHAIVQVHNRTSRIHLHGTFKRHPSRLTTVHGWFYVICRRWQVSRGKLSWINEGTIWGRPIDVKLAFNLYHKSMQKILSGGIAIASTIKAMTTTEGQCEWEHDTENILLMYEKCKY